MTGFQKFIKYAAIAFGIYLSITIIFVFLGIVRGFVKGSRDSFTDLTTDSKFRDILGDKEDTKDISQEYTNIKKLEIDLEKTELIIKNGDKLKIEGTNISSKMEIKQEGETLKIDDEKISSAFSSQNTITIYIPENQKLDNMTLEIKYMSAEIEKLNATNLKLDLYNNYCQIDELVADNFEIDNEYGEIYIYHSEVKKLKLDSDTGNEKLNMRIVESAKIEIEYSDTDIKLIGKQEDYQINYENLFGKMYLEGRELESNRETIGSGNIKIDFDGKSANTSIEFEENTNEKYL